MDGKWRRLGERTVYETEWLKVDMIDLEMPDTSRVERQSIRIATGSSAGVLAFDPNKGVLLIWRHRYATDTWAWELPGGGVEDRETPAAAAEREMLEETGWRPNKLEKLVDWYPNPSVVENKFTCYFSAGASWVGPGRDKNEAADLVWMPIDQVRAAMNKNEVSDGFALTSLLYAFQFGPLKSHSEAEIPRRA